MASAQDIIDAILYNVDSHPGARYSSRVYSDEPIITTGRQMRSYVPERIQKMKGISRYTEGRNGRPGHWLSDAQYFYLQGFSMTDYEDDYPYASSFKGCYPTYNDMSDRQLRSYFSWRTQVRHGRVEETSTAFAFMYLYELICGIGVEDPLDGFRKIQGFIEAYRGFAPEIGRFGDTWLADYVVYHGLDPELIAESRAVTFDHALAALEDAGARARALAPARRTRNAPPTIPLPADVGLEDALFDALADLSTYRVKASRLYKAHPEGFRHVACAVYVRLSIYYERQRKTSLVESWFGEKLELPYTMFGSAVFYDPEPHADAVYRLDDETTFRCSDRQWTCERHQGARNRNGKLGRVMRTVDRKLREAYGFAHPLKDDGKTPKYLDQFIDQEIDVWRAWEEAHAPREIKIDLDQLSGIRSAAAKTREALLIDEERGMEEAEGDGTDMEEAELSVADGAAAAGLDVEDGPPTAADASEGTSVGTGIAPKHMSTGPLDEHQAAWLRCLLDSGTPAERAKAEEAAGLSEDMLVDAINEALFDLVGDTVIEFGPEGPELIEDYLEDVREVLRNE